MESEARLSELAARYAALPYRVNVEQDTCDGEPVFVAEHVELRGCIAMGKTRGEAIANAHELRKEYIEVLLEAHSEVPVPPPYVRLGQIEDASIQVTLRFNPGMRPLNPEESPFSASADKGELVGVA